MGGSGAGKASGRLTVLLLGSPGASLGAHATLGTIQQCIVWLCPWRTCPAQPKVHHDTTPVLTSCRPRSWTVCWGGRRWACCAATSWSTGEAAVMFAELHCLP